MRVKWLVTDCLLSHCLTQVSLTNWYEAVLYYQQQMSWGLVAGGLVAEEVSDPVAGFCKGSFWLGRSSCKTEV